MDLIRKIYRRCKVWVEAEGSRPMVDERGLVSIRYRQEDTRRYSVKLDDLSEVPVEVAGGGVTSSDGGVASSATDSGSAKVGSAEPADSKAPATKARRPRAKRSSSDGVVRGARARRTASTPARSKKAASDTLIIYADGSCFGNPGPSGIGVLLEWKGATKEISRFLGPGTNNIAELTAIEAGLLAVKNREVPVRVHTDSAYAIGVLTEGWKAKENRELIARVQSLLREFPDVALVKVRGHAGDPRNERVDQLARDAIVQRS